MGKLHELLAVDTDATAIATKLMDEAIKTFLSKQEHFRGQASRTEFLDDARQKENTSANQEVSSTVDEKLAFLLPKVAKHYNVVYQKEVANGTAKADLVIDGKVLVKDLPATFLLGMESKLKKLREVLAAIPTLEPSQSWSPDDTLRKGVYRSAERDTARTQKDVQFKVLYDATDKHPAQIEKWSTDVTVAITRTTNFSGMWSVAKKAEVLDRLDVLVQGIKQARMRANLVEAPSDKVADQLIQFVLGTA